ncbi:hypothetical protein [Nonomuraea sediminis]|uniref:hypothetical protein n=1 Tax=Nonomuraea sediminis TaxID=2835864 RepID=UPI001BDCC509|nr:hypothetical protein [Nonomuraea sediminis]
MTSLQSPSGRQATAGASAAGDVPAEYQAWRKDRWEEVAGPNGKAKVVANGKITDRDTHTFPGVPGTWSTNEAGALTVTATAADGVTIGGTTVDGTAEVPSGCSLQFPDDRVGFAGGADGSYGLVVLDNGAVERSGLSGIDTFPHDSSWVFEASTGQLPRAAASRWGG